MAFFLGRNSKEWQLKWKLLRSNFLWCCLSFCKKISTSESIVQMKVRIEQYPHLVLFITLYMVSLLQYIFMECYFKPSWAWNVKRGTLQKELLKLKTSREK